MNPLCPVDGGRPNLDQARGTAAAVVAPENAMEALPACGFSPAGRERLPFARGRVFRAGGVEAALFHDGFLWAGGVMVGPP